MKFASIKAQEKLMPAAACFPFAFLLWQATNPRYTNSTWKSSSWHLWNS